MSAAPDAPPGVPRLGLRSAHPLAAYVLFRIGAGVVLLLVVSVLVFAGTQILPGDAASAILGRGATPDAVRALRRQLGLDHSLVHQYGAWLGGVLRGDLGTSLTAQEPVRAFIGDRVVNTLVLAGVTLAVVVPLSLTLGLLAAVRRNRLLDHVISGATLGAIALPEFVTGTLLAIGLAVSLKLVPPVSLVPPGQNPLRTPSLLVLPVLTLLISLLAYSVRMVRAGVSGVLSAEYVESLRLNGVPERRVLTRHVLRNALAPSVQVLALTAQWLVGGIVIVETVFQYPGLGQGLVQAVDARDIPVVQAIALLIAAVYVGLNILSDVIVLLLVPKLRTSVGRG